MPHLFFRTMPVAILGILSSGCVPHADAAVSQTKLVKTDGKWQLIRDGKPYLIKGAGGSGSLQVLHDRGANSNRTWGSDNIDKKLDEAQKLGMTYTVGIWLGHTENGFNYSDERAVATQFAKAKAAIDRYKDHPAVLAWGIGNEMEGYKSETDPKMWAAVQQIAAYAHQVDPNHPTMTVVAEIAGNKVESINKYCPDIDIIGINSYGGATSIPARYAKAGGVKPYVLTEFGPAGTWETGKNGWGAANELSSTAKANVYAATWNKAIKDQPMALGGYAFTWGNKQEATATWYGMLLPDGNLLGAVDAMTEAWTGQTPKQRVPEIKEMKLDVPSKTTPGATIKANLTALDPDNDPMKVNWVLQHDPVAYGSNGAAEGVPPTFPDAIVSASNDAVEVKMPRYSGAYRLFAYVYDGKGGAAVGNLPLFVEGGDMNIPKGVQKTKLPVEIYGESGGDAPYVASGYMGNSGAIKMIPDDITLPHSGKTCLKVEYNAGDKWGGVVWQSPANNWGDMAGGRDLTGAKKLTFWARGATGDETVNFSFGLIGKDKKFPDSGKGKLDHITLPTQWKQYEIDVSDQDLTHVMTGFAWTTAAHEQPVTFYLDDIQFE